MTSFNLAISEVWLCKVQWGHRNGVSDCVNVWNIGLDRPAHRLCIQAEHWPSQNIESWPSLVSVASTMGSIHIGQIHSPVFVFLFFGCFVERGESCGKGRFRGTLESISEFVEASVVDSWLVDIVSSEVSWGRWHLVRYAQTKHSVQIQSSPFKVPLVFESHGTTTWSAWLVDWGFSHERSNRRSSV